MAKRLVVATGGAMPTDKPNASRKPMTCSSSCCADSTVRAAMSAPPKAPLSPPQSLPANQRPSNPRSASKAFADAMVAAVRGQADPGGDRRPAVQAAQPDCRGAAFQQWLPTAFHTHSNIFQRLSTHTPHTPHPVGRGTVAVGSPAPPTGVPSRRICKVRGTQCPVATNAYGLHSLWWEREKKEHERRRSGARPSARSPSGPRRRGVRATVRVVFEPPGRCDQGRRLSRALAAPAARHSRSFPSSSNGVR